jgi:hypothetical protein
MYCNAAATDSIKSSCLMMVMGGLVVLVGWTVAESVNWASTRASVRASMLASM